MLLGGYVLTKAGYALNFKAGYGKRHEYYADRKVGGRGEIACCEATLAIIAFLIKVKAKQGEHTA